MNLNTEQYFSTVPNITCPRSVFDRSFSHKTTMNVNYLYPIFVDECLPGDSMRMHFEVFGRLLNPLVAPIMDELYFETLWFKIPFRLTWTHFVNFCGEQENPDDTTDYLMPTINSGSTGFGIGSLADIFGIPIGVPNLNVNSLAFRAYNLVYNQWFRDVNLIESVTVPTGESDDADNYKLLKSAKMHDYFTSMLPQAQKGDPVEFGVAGTIPVSIPVVGTGQALGLNYNDGHLHQLYDNNNTLGGSRYRDAGLVSAGTLASTGNGFTVFGSTDFAAIGVSTSPTGSGLKTSGTVDLSRATGISISDFRFAMKLQQKKERDMIGGTRYISWVKTHFNVDSDDARLQRAEFLGSTREMIDINSVIQTSSSDSVSPQGNITAYGVISHHGSAFSTSFTEHSFLLGIARIRHNPLYQRGLYRMWTRSSLLDYYLPVFNGISEQPVRNDEIFAQGASVVDSNGVPVDEGALGFQEAWAPYRYRPSMITGYLRSAVNNSHLSLDYYHLAQNFTQLPVLNQSFIEESIPMDRVLALSTEDDPTDLPQFIFDFRFYYDCARPMPVHNIPDGLGMGRF